MVETTQKHIKHMFSTPFGYFYNKDLAGKLEKYIFSISKELKGVDSNIATNYKHNLLESKFNFFKSNHPIIKEAVQFFVTCLKLTVNSVQEETFNYKISINESWYHISEKNSVHESHRHPGCSWWGLFYVNAGDSDSGYTLFDNPIQDSYRDCGTEYFQNATSFNVKPEIGKLVFFPSYLNHYQSFYKGDSKRIVVAFNCSLVEKVPL